MKLGVLVLVVLFSSLSSRGLGKSQFCQTVDVREFQRPAQKAYFSEIRDQMDSGWCYAFAGADLLTDRLQIPISAYAIAFDYNSKLSVLDHLLRRIHQFGSDSGGYFPDGGWVDTAIEQVLENNNICRVDQVPSRILDGDSVQKYFIRAEELFSQGQFTEAFLQRVFPGLPIDSAKLLISGAGEKDDSLFDLYSRASGTACMPVPRGLAPIQVVSSDDGELQMSEFVELSLARARPRPVALRIHSEVVFKEDESSFFEHWIGDHYVVVLGKKENPQTHLCQYLIRDSFGADCDQYNAGRVHCNGDGTYWLQQQDLNVISEEAIFLK